MLIKVPNKLFIAGHLFTIEQDVDNLDIDGQRARIDYKRLRILLNLQKKESVLSEGFIHEILHGIDEVYLNSQIDNENIIEPFAEGIWQVLQQLGIQFDLTDIK